jgi:hypothetical protein
VPALLDILGWHAVFVVLAIGPAFGALGMWRLRASGVTTLADLSAPCPITTTPGEAPTTSPR